MKNDSAAIRQPIYVDGAATQLEITIHFSPSPVTSLSPRSNEEPGGNLLLRVNDAAERLSLSRTNLYKLLTNGELESIKVGRSRLIPTDALEEFVRRHRNRSDES